jgi:hypothetical protein
VIDSIIEFIIKNWFFLVIIAVLLFVLSQQRRKVTRFSSRDEFLTFINAGFPVVVEFFDDT